MNAFVPERSNPWIVYSTEVSSPSQAGFRTEAPWKSLGASTSAISYGFVATAVLISMFLIMAIFEHLFRPISSFSSHEAVTEISLEAGLSRKIVYPHRVPPVCTSEDFLVVMPGQNFPTYIARPAPVPCQREGIRWPSHEQSPRFS